MASVNLSGTLLNPEGEPDEGAIVKFTLLSTTGSTILSSKSQLEVPQDGLYDIDIEYGNLRVDYVNEDGSMRFVAIVTVNADTVATSLPELLNANVPPTDAQLLEFQTILADAVAAKDAAEAALAGIPIYGTAATADVTTSAADTTAGRLLKVGDFGLGGLSPNSPADLNDINASGFYTVLASTTNAPTTQLGTLLHVNYSSTNAASQTFYNAQADETYVRREISGVWSGWVELYHSGNTNFNVFGGDSAGDIIAIGGAIGTAIARFYLHLNSPSAPVSATVSGTFDVHDETGVSVLTGETPAINASLSSNKIAIFDVTTTGLTVNANYTLRTVSASSITVNF